MLKKRILFLLLPIVFGLVGLSCSINKMAINAVSNALTGEGSSDVFTGDTDPQLVGDALPFAIKMYESLLAENPNHQGLLLTTGSLFIMYANIYVQGPADMLPPEAWEERDKAMERAKKLYVRGTDILYSALEKKYPGFGAARVQDGSLEKILKKCKKDDTGLLYWTVAGGLSAYSANVFDFDLGARIPELSAMIKRAYELDPDFGGATLDSFFVLFYASLPEVLGGNRKLAEDHFEKALKKNNGNSAGLYVSYAQSLCVPTQDYDGDYDAFKDNLEKALAVDVDADPAMRLENIINQRKARFLLDTAYLYFSFLPAPDYYDY